MDKKELPKYVFSENEDKQLSELEANPLLKEFYEFRCEQSDNPQNPNYHFYAPDGRINDPNGLCFWNGRYHLFYQQYPPVNPRQHWGHAISEDMVHWRDLTPAIYPDVENAVFSNDSVGVSSIVAPSAMPDGNGGLYVIYNVGDSNLSLKRRGCMSLMRHIQCADDGSMIGNINTWSSIWATNKSQYEAELENIVKNLKKN